jgi:L-ribulose-5-phosphate 3-epimerase UlaE
MRYCENKLNRIQLLIATLATLVRDEAVMSERQKWEEKINERKRATFCEIEVLLSNTDSQICRLSHDDQRHALKKLANSGYGPVVTVISDS